MTGLVEYTVGSIKNPELMRGCRGPGLKLSWLGDPVGEAVTV